jgi:hypothetical protein
MVRNAVSNINPVREDRAARVLVLVLNQQSATISLHFTRLAIAPGQRYIIKSFINYIQHILEFEVWYLFFHIISKKNTKQNDSAWQGLFVLIMPDIKESEMSRLNLLSKRAAIKQICEANEGLPCVSTTDLTKRKEFYTPQKLFT